ncbi:N-acetylmuramoyl-L-alanine amidase [uncultured Clostridium sp.]|uniref:peptidoglycan recognition protein family protein n=1 Tax=uncultured Clostridium sp. TaxID=59620 RepID=UPI0025E925B6|nr:N-acetylmuramoyl-L-alanine amidase [uncultured Clostridium sp.]
MEIKQKLVSSSKYSVKCPYSMTPIGICIHNTANDASAANEISYMISNNNEVSFHIAVDDKEAIQGIPFNRNAWHAGDGGSGTGNRKYIAIEICYSKSGGTRFTNAEKNAAKLTAQLLKKYGWNINNVKKHQDFSGKYCPYRTLDLGWQRFLNMISAELGGSSTTELYRVRKTWEDAASQVGAFKVLENAIAECKKHKGYSVFNSKGVVVYKN